MILENAGLYHYLGYITILYLVGINLTLLILMGVDKRRAQRDSWRIRESTLLLLGMMGGCVGGMAGMLLFHHKTKHPRFVFGYPLIFFAHLMLAVYLTEKLLT